MDGRDAINSKYFHKRFLGTFAVTVTGTPADIATDLLATAFAASTDAWLSYFGSVYPKLPDDAMFFIVTGASASGYISKAVTGVTFSAVGIPANSVSQPFFLTDLSMIKLQTNDADIVIGG